MDLEVDLEEEMADHPLTCLSAKQIRLLDDDLLVDEVFEFVELRVIKLVEQLYADVVEDVNRKDLLERRPSFFLI